MEKKRKLEKQTKKGIYIAIGVFIFALLYALKNTSYFVRTAGFVFFILLVFFADSFFNFGFKKRHYAIVILITITAVLLSPLYYISPLYDKILHLMIPILLSILIFFLVNKLNTSFSVKLVITFALMTTMVAMHEVGEYLLDQLFDWKLQGVFIKDYSGVAKLKIIQGRNDDTMIDMILSTVGSLVFVLMKISIKNYKKIKRKLKEKIKL